MNALAPLHPPFTTAEFHKMAARGAFGDLRVELRRGMILKMSPKHLPHATMQSDLIFGLRAAIDSVGLDWTVVTETSVSFGNGFDPMPDIVVFDPVLIRDPMGTINPEAVKLIVEVADSSMADDLGEKREDYARFGVAEYWVADVKARRVVRHAAPSEDRFGREDTVGLPGIVAMATRTEVAVRLR